MKFNSFFLDSGLVNPNSSTSSFSVFDSYKENAPHGIPKFGFGYGVVLDDEVSVYTQTDPCPCKLQYVFFRHTNFLL